MLLIGLNEINMLNAKLKKFRDDTGTAVYKNRVVHFPIVRSAVRTGRLRHCDVADIAAPSLQRMQCLRENK